MAIILGEDKRPKIKCPKCQGVIIMDIKLFMDDVTKPIRSNCPKCHAEIYTALLILSHDDLRGLYQCIQTCIEALKPKTMRLT